MMDATIQGFRNTMPMVVAGPRKKRATKLYGVTIRSGNNVNV